MGRIVKEHAVRRDEILDAGQRLVYGKGYQRMTIQDILDDLGISKGAFYHYFGSKEALLEAIIARLIDDAERQLASVAADPTLSAVEKFQAFFGAIARQKNEQKPFLIALVRVWYDDDNAVVREKVKSEGREHLLPLLTALVHQGVAEGSLTTAYPDDVAGVFLALSQGLNDTLARMMLAYEPGRDDLRRIERTVAVYADSIERVMGAPPGSLRLVEPEMLRDWANTFKGDV